MSDQAQGLRVLADQVREDHSAPERLLGRPYESSGDAGSKPPVGQATNQICEPFVSGIIAADTRHHRRRPRVKPQPRARILAVTSGKGGVGKSNFCTNLAITLGQRGKRVIMLDADIGMANAHILLGSTPKYTLEHVMQGSKTLAQVLYGAAENVQLIAGGSGIAELANLSNKNRETFLSGLRELDTTCDIIIIDTGAGVAPNVLAFVCAVNEVIIVTTPEPTAIANAYATIKVVSQDNPGVRLMLVVNMVHSSGEGIAVAGRLSAITRQFLELEVEYIGCIPIDPAVPIAVHRRTPFVSGSPGCAASAGINQIIRKLGFAQQGIDSRVGIEGFINRMQRFFGIRPPLLCQSGRKITQL